MKEWEREIDGPNALKQGVDAIIVVLFIYTMFFRALIIYLLFGVMNYNIHLGANCYFIVNWIDCAYEIGRRWASFISCMLLFMKKKNFH